MAITPTQWARIHAKAWCESKQPNPTTFQDDLERDPAKAIFAVSSQFGISRADKIIDLDYDSDPVARQLRDSATPALLLQVIRDGMLNGHHLSGGSWIRPNPQEEITLPERAVNPAVSLEDWTRIYAYIWYQYLFNGDKNTRAQFEKDPASVLQAIVDAIKASYGVTIAYTPGDRLLDFGLPPTKDDDPTVLSNIENAWDAKQYRYKATLTC